MAQAAKAIKALSPSTRVIFYINTALDFLDYRYHEKILQRPDLWLYYPDGKTPYYINCVGCPLTDFSLEAARQFWIQEYLNTTQEYGGVFDGLFADRAAGAPKGCRNESGYAIGHRLVLEELQARIAPLGHMVIANNVVYQGVGGTMIEGFAANESQVMLPLVVEFPCNNRCVALSCFIISPRLILSECPTKTQLQHDEYHYHNHNHH